MIYTVSLFPVLHDKLIGLLTGLTPEQWDAPTIARLWTVKDIAAHLLDTNIRTLANRDNYPLLPDREIASYQQLVDYLNHLNTEWISAAKRISPPVLIDLLDSTGKAYNDYMATLDPDADAVYSVAWAGEETSKNWFHVAREYTEKWHHQQQIRDAVGIPGIMTLELYYPVIDTFMRGLPHTYRDVATDEGTAICITIDGEAGGNWFLKYHQRRWQLSGEGTQTDASLIIPPDIAWKVFTKGMKPAAARPFITVAGDEALALKTLSLIAVMA